MNARDLKRELERLAIHPLSETNVIRLSVVGTDLEIETDTSHLCAEIAELRQNEAQLQKDASAEEKKREEAEAERDKLQAAIAEIKDPESGMTAADFVRQLAEHRQAAEDAQAKARDAERELAKCQAEVAALRKRKGVAVGIVRHAHEVLTFLGYVTQSVSARHQKDAQRLLDAIRTA